MKKIFDRVMIGAGAACLLLAFQNCSPFSGKSLLVAPPSAEIVNSPPEQLAAIVPPWVGAAAGGEMQILKTKIDMADSVEFVNALPKGASFDSSTKTLYWLPQKGQAGSYNLDLKAGAAIGSLKIDISAITEENLKIFGPPETFADGDVGYIFVHGAGSVDRCVDHVDLANYWGASIDVIAPDVANRTVVCYDGRRGAIEAANKVAEQISQAKCGRFNKCVIITHSMGGLAMEHLFLNAPTNAVYQSVKDRTILMVSIASASGGSKVADIVYSDGGFPQEIMGGISRIFGANDASTGDLRVSVASHTIAPMTGNVGIPTFMVAGYSMKTLKEDRGIVLGFFDSVVDDVSPVVFNSDRTLASLDSLTGFESRSDGLVDFRSACGVLSDDPNNGMGRSATTDQHFSYCYSAPKKLNHYPLFVTNMNHYVISTPYADCHKSDNLCTTRIPNPFANTMSVDVKYNGMSAVEVIRAKIGKARTGVSTVIAANRINGV
jgi:hypothetical protein